MRDNAQGVASGAAQTGEAGGEVIYLSLSAFLASVSFGVESAALPFLAQDLGAGSAGVGALGAIGSVTYSAVLFVLLMYFGGIWERHCPRRMSMTAQWCLCAGSVLFAAAHSMPALYAIATAKGVAAACFWPPLMAWFSAGREGADLNRRLSYFNLSWCSGLIVGPAVGGELYEIWQELPFAVASLCQAAGACALWRSRPPTASPPSEPSKPETLPAEDIPQWKRVAFRRVALVSHFTGYVVMGLARYQFPVLARSLSIGPGIFGWALMMLSLSMTFMFWMLGRSHRWHFRHGLLLLAQVGMACAMFAAAVARSAAMLGFITTLCGLCVGITYTSNLFYGASGDPRRGRRMAIHEFLIGLGFGVGGQCGGLINSRWGLRSAYPICAWLIMLGAAAQIFILRMERERQRSSTV